MILHLLGRWSIAQPYKQIVGIRNRIVRNYAELDTEAVWAVVQNEVPGLLKRSRLLLEEQ